jgi:hypothetical protein
MDEMHEYTVKGHPREKIIFSIATISIFLSPYISELCNYIVNDTLNFNLSVAVSGSAIFGILYFAFGKVIWKTKLFASIFNYPNLNGEYEIEAISLLNPSGNEVNWKGVMKIQQSWDKLIITLKTENSTSYSKSIVGAIRHVPSLHYELYYHYENIPGCSQNELDRHEGLCNVCFEEHLNSGEAYYFNNIKERKSYGTMKLKRRL